VTRLVGDLGVAEDAVQDACAVALAQWPEVGIPSNAGSWLIGVARHKALDQLLRERRRPDKEAALQKSAGPDLSADPACGMGDDQLALIFMCCHPALDVEARIALTLRAVCGLSTAEIASVFLMPEATVAKRLVRAKQKIRAAAIPFRVPSAEERAERLAGVLRVIFLMFTAGHADPGEQGTARIHPCDDAIRLARRLRDLLPDEPEAAGLLALLLLTDARRPARLDRSGELVLLEDQDRRLWDRGKIVDGTRLLDTALAARRPGPYQLWAAIASCHSSAPSAAATNWHQIAALYGELIRYEATPVVEANRAVAVAMADGPLAGLQILAAVGAHPRMQEWAPFHMARADLLRRLRRSDEAREAYELAIARTTSEAERAFVRRRLSELDGAEADH
jgi:RNA polymerase sigma-70 factor (ECF subfamily)